MIILAILVTALNKCPAPTFHGFDSPMSKHDRRLLGPLYRHQEVCKSRYGGRSCVAKVIKLGPENYRVTCAEGK